MFLLAGFFGGVDTFIWGLLVDWIIFTGIYFSLGIDLINLRTIPMAIRDALKLFGQTHLSHDGQLTPMMNLIVSSGAINGLGNLTFTALAIIVAGPGVVFWSVVSGLVGFGTRFLEAYLSVQYRRRNELGEYVGGPMYYLNACLPVGLKWMAPFFAVFSLFSLLGIGNFAQMHSLTFSMSKLMTVPLPVTSCLVAAVTSVVIFGGLKTVARFNLILIPLAIVLNVGFCVVVLASHLDQVVDAITLIVNEAFHPSAIFGGTMVAVIEIGIRSGIFSNGAALGREVVLQASASPADPFYQGCVSVLVGLIDLILVFLTSLVIVMSKTYLTMQEPSYVLWNSFNWGIAGSGWLLFAIAIPMALTTIATFCVIGERSFEFLFGARRRTLFRSLWICGVLVGPFLSIQFIKTLYAIASSLQCLPNLIGLVVVSSVTFPEIRSRFQALSGIKSSIPQL